MRIDPELLARCKKNNRKAHNELYKLCFGFMMAICLRYASNREDAEALLNGAFLKVISNLEKYNPEIPFGSWVHRLTVNSIIDEFRKDKKRREHMTNVDFQDTVPDHQPVDFNEAAQALEAEALERMIQALPEMSRKVFNLYAIEGYSHKEIGEMLNMSDGTSKWHVSSARKALQAMIRSTMKQLMTVLV